MAAKPNEPGEEAQIIQKFPIRCNLESYDKACRTFDWGEIEKEFDWFPGRRINAAYEAVDRQAGTWRRNKVALYFEGADGTSARFTFSDLEILSNKLGNVLKGLGVRRGDRVFTFLPRIPELY